MTKKMIFIQYCPDDMLNGCRLLSGPAELVYRRICDHIYTSNNNLFDEDITWNVLTEKFNWDHQLIKDELVRKKKIYIEDNAIRNDGCNKAIDKALHNHESAILKGRKGAEAKRSSASSSAKAEDEQTINHELLTINHKTNNRKLFEEKFWINIRYKKGKEGAWKSFKHINFEKEKFTPGELANKYNDYFDNIPDYMDTPKWVQGWLTDRRWEDEDSMTPQAFAKKHNITDGRFLKFEDGVYHFHFKESFGSYTLKYDTKGNIIKDGKRQERTTKEGTGNS